MAKRGAKKNVVSFTFCFGFTKVNLMSSLKVSVKFLEGPVDGIVTRGSRIAKSMKGNKIFKTGPVSPEGLEEAINHLSAMDKKSKSGKAGDVAECKVALSDVDDYIRQIADFLNRYSYGKEELETTGFKLTDEPYHKPEAASGWKGGFI